MTFSPQQPNARAWEWPPVIVRVPDLLKACRSGFDLVIVHGEFDNPIYKLKRDGELSPWGRLDPSVARTAHLKRGYFGHMIKLADGSWLLKLTTRAPGAKESS